MNRPTRPICEPPTKPKTFCCSTGTARRMRTIRKSPRRWRWRNVTRNWRAGWKNIVRVSSCCAKNSGESPWPAGLKEQIISERAAFSRMNSRRERKSFLSRRWRPSSHRWRFWRNPGCRNATATTTNFHLSNQMAGLALRGYQMDLTTNDVSPIRAYPHAKPCAVGFHPAGGSAKSHAGRLRGRGLAGQKSFHDLFPHRQAASAGPAERSLAVCG